MENAKIEKFKCGILSNFQTMWNTFWFCDHSKTKIMIFCDNLLITRNFFLRLMTTRGFHEFSQRIKQSSSEVLLQYLHNNHSVWKSPKMSHLNFSILAFPNHFCPFVRSSCKRSSLRSQCWMRLFLWFSNTVSNTYNIEQLEMMLYNWRVELAPWFESTFSWQLN